MFWASTARFLCFHKAGQRNTRRLSVQIAPPPPPHALPNTMMYCPRGTERFEMSDIIGTRLVLPGSRSSARIKGTAQITAANKEPGAVPFARRGARLSDSAASRFIGGRTNKRVRRRTLALKGRRSTPESCFTGGLPGQVGASRCPPPTLQGKQHLNSSEGRQHSLRQH